MTTDVKRGEVVWRFTNQKELNKSEFISYFERKIFRTVRSFEMLPVDKIFILKRSNDLNTAVLGRVLKGKFQVVFGKDVNVVSDNLSQVAEDIFRQVVDGDFHYVVSEVAPLRYLSDKEVELYAKLKNIEGSPRERDGEIQTLFSKFFVKNPDLELNILKAQTQIENIDASF